MQGQWRVNSRKSSRESRILKPLLVLAEAAVPDPKAVVTPAREVLGEGQVVVAIYSSQVRCCSQLKNAKLVRL